MNKNNQTSILVVEDDVALNDAYNAILSSAGYNVETSFNGQEALDLLMEETLPLPHPQTFDVTHRKVA